MTCGEYRKQASAFLDGEIDEDVYRPLFRHLAECDACWQFYRRIEAIHDAFGEGSSEPEMVVPAPLLARRIVLPLASMVLGVFLTILTAVLMTLAVTSPRGEGYARGERYAREEIPAAFLPTGPWAAHGAEGRRP